MRLLFGLYLLVFAAVASAQALAPDAQIKKISDEVIAMAKRDKDIRAGDQTRINELIEAKVLPHFNFTHMTALAVGRNWPKASAEQQAALTGEFRTLLVRTYSSALSAYKNQSVVVMPMRKSAGDSDVTIRTQIKQPGGETISVDYSMENTPGGWLVYDVVVGGVSLVTNYRESFNAAIRGGGVDGLIRTLAGKNRLQEMHASAKSG